MKNSQRITKTFAKGLAEKIIKDKYNKPYLKEVTKGLKLVKLAEKELPVKLLEAFNDADLKPYIKRQNSITFSSTEDRPYRDFETKLSPYSSRNHIYCLDLLSIDEGIDIPQFMFKSQKLFNKLSDHCKKLHDMRLDMKERKDELYNHFNGCYNIKKLKEKFTDIEKYLPKEVKKIVQLPALKPMSIDELLNIKEK